MTIDSVFLNIGRGNRISSQMGLQMAEGYAYRFGAMYRFVEIPLQGFVNHADESKSGDSAARNQYVEVVPACTVDVKGYNVVEVEPNPLLGKFGTISGGTYRIHPGDGRKCPSFYMAVRRDVGVADIPWAVRLYLIP